MAPYVPALACNVHVRAARTRDDRPMTSRKLFPAAPLVLTLALGICGPAAAQAGQPSVPARADSEQTVTLEQVTVNGLLFDVRTAGPKDGDVVFLLHGFPQTSFQWRKQLPVLAAAGYRVIAPDLRAVSPGARPAGVLAYNIINYLDDLLKLADHYQAPRFHLVGHDVGGTVAWGAGMVFPAKLKSLTVLSVPHPAAYAKQLSDPNSCQRKASWWYSEVLKPDAAQNPALWAVLRDSWSTMAPDAAAEYQRVLGTPDAMDAAINVFRANFTESLEVPAAAPVPIEVPTVYVWGDRDVNNCGDGEPLTRALCPGSYRYEQLEGVSHWISEEAPDQLNRILLEHFASHPE